MLTPEKLNETWRNMPVPSSRKQVDAIIALAPERREEMEAGWRNGKLTRTLANEILAGLRKARLPVVAPEVIERVHEQSRVRLIAHHEAQLGKARAEELARHERTAEHNRRVLFEERAVRAVPTEAQQRQQIIDYWYEQKLADETAERHFREQLDPCGLGLYGAIPWPR